MSEEQPQSEPTGYVVPAGSQTTIPADDLNRYRGYYLLVYLLQIPLYIGILASKNPVYNLLFLPWFILFLWLFLKAVRLAGMSTGKVIGIAVLLLIPIIGIITLLVVDFQLSDTVDRAYAEEEEPRLSRLSYWSLIMFWFPLAGLPMAIVALYHIQRSRGMLTGKGFAISGIVMNSFVLILHIWALIAIIADTAKPSL
jgi:hypothetical protein